LTTDGSIQIYRSGQPYGSGYSTGATLIATTDPLITANAWNHVEIQVCIHDTLGWIRIAVNGVHRYALTGADTRANATYDTVASIGWAMCLNANTTHNFYLDDVYIYDFTGTAATYTDWCPTVDGSGIATNYMGEWQCMYLPPVADTAEDDWVASTGTDSAAMVNELVPNDANYISSTAANDLSEFTLTDLPEDITLVRGLMAIGRMSKSDSGPAMIKYGMKSVAATTDATERPVTVEPTYWWDFLNVDPNSSSRWTRASLNAAWIRLTRSA
jgi:hypothetical protein